MLRVLPYPGQGDLVGAEGALDLDAVNGVGAGPALRGAQDDRRPAHRTRRGRHPGSGILLDRPDAGVRGRQLMVQVGEHGGRVVAGDHHRVPALRGEQADDVGVGRAPEHGRPGDLVAVEVQDRQHRAVATGVEERRDLPRCRQRTGLGLAVADHAGHQQVGVVERGTGGVGERVAEFAALVDAARGLHTDVARYSPGSRELPHQRGQAVQVSGDPGIDLAVGTVEIGVREQRGPTVTGPGHIQAVRAGVADQPVEQRVDHRQTRTGAPVAEQARFDVGNCQRITQQRIGLQVDLGNRQVVRRRPPTQIQRTVVLGIGRRHRHRGHPRGDRHDCNLFLVFVRTGIGLSSRCADGRRPW